MKIKRIVLSTPPSKEDRLQAAKEGTEFELNGIKYTIQKACNNNQGRWCCITHNKTFGTQFEKDTHIEKGKHTLAWLCAVCGQYEAP